MADEPDPARCPVCGRPNRCALATGACSGGDAPCWCTEVVIPAAAQLAAPAAARGKACLCADCARLEPECCPGTDTVPPHA